MILRLPRNFIFPLTILAFVGIPVAYVNIIFTTTTRWAFLVVLTLYLLAKRRLMAGFQSFFGVALLSYCAWCLCTYTWSEVPQLSIEKAAAFSLLAVAFASAGQEWIQDRGSLRALTCLVPVTAVALFATVGGGANGGEAQRGIEFQEGLTANPNMLGSLIAMAIPLLLWNAYKYRTVPQVRWLWFALLALAAIALLRTYSRSAMLAAGMIGVGFCLSLKLPRAAFVLALIAGALLIAAAAGTAVLDTVYKDYVVKGATEDYISQYSQGTQEGGILYSREQVWRQSYENAQRGGWYGAGYGVTVGDTSFQGGATAVGYGREKANSQLAIVEETGLVGLCLYLVLLFALFAPLVRAHRRETVPDMKVALGIIIGALAGFTIMSIFEAWWVAPGSPESAYFWSLAGIGLGAARSSAFASSSLRQRGIVPQPAFYAGKFQPQRGVKG